MADVERGTRPLSPHITIYRPQLTSITSILTRITGNGLIVGTLMVIWWLLAAASGPDAFATADAILRSWFGDIVMALSVWALWYHTLAGVRHLIWDQVVWLELGPAYALGYAVIGGSFVLTIITLLLV